MATLLTQKVWRKTLVSITATILPQTPRETLVSLVEAGVTIFRINLSHFDKKSKAGWRARIREIVDIGDSEHVILGIMLDTQGPEFRVKELKTQTASKGSRRKPPSHWDYDEEEIRLTLDPSALCDKNTIAVSAPGGARLSRGNEEVVFCDGEYRAVIKDIHPDKKSMTIIPDSKLRLWHKAKVNFPGMAIKANPTGRREREAIEFFIGDLRKSLDPKPHFMFAQSFVKAGQDVAIFKNIVESYELLDPIIIAKLETFESSRDPNLTEIVKEASAIMIARGDLANETSRQEVPRLQRMIIKAAKDFGKPVLLATQVYASMKDKGTTNCTRPEAEDVRSALELGVDGFVLTGETTKREDPETVVKALTNQIVNDEKELIDNNHFSLLRDSLQRKFQRFMKDRNADPSLQAEEHLWLPFLNDPSHTGQAKDDIEAEKQRWLGTIDFAIAAVFRANTYRAMGLFPFTLGGGTAREMSRFYPETEIYALTQSVETAQKLLLFRCTHPVMITINDHDPEEFSVNDLKELVKKIGRTLELREKKPESKYAIGTMAHPLMVPGGTDILLRIRIRETEE